MDTSLQILVVDVLTFDVAVLVTIWPCSQLFYKIYRQ